VNLRQLGVATVAVVCVSSFVAPRLAAARPKKMTNPDFTRGDKIPKGADHDWTLGATGARGWMFSERLETTKARQIAITKVEKGSPADGILAVGDVILGAGGKRFSYDPRTELGKALTRAESEAGGGRLSLVRWRAGTTGRAVVKLPVLGTYSRTAPFDCPKSRRILERGCKALAKRMSDPTYKQNGITRSLNALALLASGNPEYQPLVRREARWAAAFSAKSMQTWWYGYVITFLSEYVTATADEAVMPGLRRLALEAANGQSIVGSWGHRFANPDGRLGGYGMMNSPGVPLTIGLVLAREAGVDDPKVALAIERSAKLIRFYIGKGAVPYGDHHPWIQTHEDNGKCGMASVLFGLLGEVKGAEFFSRMSVASYGPERDTGHTGNFFNVLWSLPGVARSGPHATGAWLKEFGWYFDLARRWDGSFLHQGPPAMRRDKYRGWDCTGGYLLAYAMPLRKICLTGKRVGIAARLDRASARALIEDGRGWSNNDRNSFYDKLGTGEIMRRLGSWSPVVRERAAMALGRRKEAPIPELLQMLESPSIESRYGACQALAMLKDAAAPAVPALRNSLSHHDLWLRVKAADALARIGKPAMSAVPELLRMLARAPARNDPRRMEQRYLCFALFNRRGGMLARSLEGVDREALYAAVRAGLRNQDGRARGSIGSVYGKLRFEEVRPLLPAIHRAIVEPAPSGIMFASGIRLEGLKLLARFRIREGMPLCIDIMEIEKWGKRHRITSCLNILAQYGGAAKPVLPKLRDLGTRLRKHWEAKGLKPQIDLVDKIIADIEAATDAPELRSMEADLRRGK
jgi:hypothetical protein